MCKRLTGKGKDTWMEHFRRRRQKAVQQGMVSAAKLFTFDEVENLVRNFGFRPDNFYPNLVSVKVAKSKEVEHQGKERALNPKGEMQDIEQVVRYRMKPHIIP